MEIYLGLISTEMYHLVRRNFSEQLVGFSNSYRVSHSATKFNVCVCVLSYVGLFETPWIVAGQAPLSREFSRQEYWGGLPSPTLGIFLIKKWNLGLLWLLC